MNRLHGRAEALTRARQRLERACAGEGGLLLFTGEPGIGKSRLAEQLAGDGGEAGARVAWGRCWEAGGAPAYWPWIQIFRELGLDTDPFAAGLDPGEDAEQGRFRVFDAVVGRLRGESAKQPLLLVLDDLQAADVASLLVLLLLVRQLRAASILVVGTCRDAESRMIPEVASLLVKVAREGETLPLARLNDGESSAWIREAWPSAGEADVAQLGRLTEGHPLFLVEALRLGPGVHARRRVVEGLGAVLDERLAHLAPSTHSLLQAAAVLGRGFDSADVAAIAGATGDDVHRAMAEAAAASIVLPDGGDGAHFRFSHVLLRDRLYAALTPSARAALHWQAGGALLQRGRDAQAVVHHLVEGAAAGTPERLAEVAHAAGAASLERLAFEEAAHTAEQALALVAPAPGTARAVCGLKLVAAEAALRLGELARGRLLCVEAAAEARALAADDLVIKAALVYGTDLASGTVDPTMIDLLRQALARLPAGDSPPRARVAARLAAALSPPLTEAATAEMRTLAGEAVAIARRLSDPPTLLYVLPFVAATTRFDGPDSERFTLLGETVALARTLGQRMPLLNALPGYITTLLARARTAEAEQELAGYDVLLAELPAPRHQWRSRLLHALVHLVRGQFAEAEQLNTEVRTQAEAARSPAAMSLWMFQRFSMAHLRGQAPLISDTAAPLVAQFASAPSTLPFAAWLAAATGQRDQAAAHLRAFNLDPTNLLGLCAAGDTCVLLPDLALARTLYALLKDAVAGVGPLGALAPGSLFGPPARTLGALAALLGHTAEAIAHYQDAAAGCAQAGAHWLAAECKQAAERLGDRPAATAPGAGPRLQLRREGDVWAVTPAGGASFRVKHGKGFDYLACLLERPGREVHVLELLGIDHKPGDAGAVLDTRAKAEYRARLDDLRDQLAEAEQFGDTARAARARTELDAIAEQLAGAVGLGGRDRIAASEVERARINVQRRLKDAIDRIATVDPALGRYLAAAVRTGTTCLFTPI